MNVCKRKYTNDIARLLVPHNWYCNTCNLATTGVTGIPYCLLCQYNNNTCSIFTAIQWNHMTNGMDHSLFTKYTAIDIQVIVIDHAVIIV